MMKFQKSLGLILIGSSIFLAHPLGNSAHDLHKSEKIEKIEKNSTLQNIEALQNEIVQSEENRDKKTFQVVKTIIKAPPVVIFKTFTDYQRAPEIFSYLKKSKILTSDGPKKTIFCEVEIAGGLFKFEYVLEYIEHAPTLVEWRRVSGAFKSNEGYWKFEPLDKSKSTLVTYSKYVDGGFLFPHFMVKKELRNTMPVILTELKRSVETLPD